MELNWRNTQLTWCQNWDLPSRMDLTGVQSPQMDWDAETLPERASDNTWNSCSVVRSLQRKRKKSVVICWYDVARKDETLPTLGLMLLRTIKRSSRRISRDLRIMWNRNAIFPLQVSQKSTSRIRNGRTIRNGPEASGERLFLQGTWRDDSWQNCFWNKLS